MNNDFSDSAINLAREGDFSLGGLAVRPSVRQVGVGGASETLEPRIMQVLVALSRRRGEVVSRDDLIETCWGGLAVSDGALHRCISRLRKLGEASGAFSLETITKVGYRMHAAPDGEDAPVHGETPRSDAPATPAQSGAASRSRSIAAGALNRRTAWLAAGAVVAVLLLAGAGGFLMRGPGGRQSFAGSAAQPADALTLAVMPFDALSANSGDDLLAAGLSREIRNTLSRVRGLKVLADTSSLAAVAGKMSATDLGQKKWADLVVNGSLTRTGDTVKLTAELVDAKTGLNVWTGGQSGTAADLDGLRGRMSAALFQEIVARVGPNRLQQLAPPRPMDPRAYALTMEAYQINTTLRGIQNRGAKDEALTAGDRSDALLNQALAIEPDNAEALMLKGILLLDGATHAIEKSGATLQDRLAQAAEFFRKALAVDPDNAEALVNLAEHYRRNEWRLDEARPLFERALAINPNNVYARTYWSFYLTETGRCREAVEQTRIIAALNPAFGNGLADARGLKCAGQLDASNKVYMRAVDAERANLFTLSEFYLSLLERRDAKALRELVRHVRDDLWSGKPSAPVADWLARISEAADAVDGKPQAFLRRLDGELRAFDNTKPDENGRRGSDRYWTFALEYAHAGETSHAIDLLGRALKAGSLYIPETMPYGEYEFTPEMRKDPRYQALWRNDSRLVELMRLRLEALKARQSSGFMPDGTHVDALPLKLTEDSSPS